MATPGYRPQLGDRPAEQSKRQVGTNTDSFGGNVGRAMQDFGRGMTSAADVFQRIELENSASRSRERIVEFDNRAREDTHGPEGYFARTGTKALGENRESYAEALGSHRDSILADIGDPAEREAVKRALDEKISGLMDTAAVHETEQSRAAAIATRESARSSAEENALTFFDDDVMFEKYLDEAVAHADDLGTFVGTDAETQAAARDQIVSNLVRNRAILVADRDPEAAMELIENDERLSPTHRRELRENLKPLVDQHRAEQVVLRHTKTAHSPETKFTERLIMKESGGDPLAQAEGSSASGLMQFTDGTWDNFTARLRQSGRVPEGYDLSTMSVSEIRNLRFDEDFVRATAGDWVAELDGTLRKIGATVNDGNRYVVHHMGAGGASWLLSARPGQTAREVYRANGKSWEAVVRANPNMFTENMTAMQATQAVRSYFGAGSGLAPSGDGVVAFDTAAALDEANRIEDPDERAAAIAAINTRAAEMNAQSTAVAGEALNTATERYLENGTTELTLQEKLTLGAAGLESFRTYVERDRTNSLADNPVTVDQLMTMAMSPNRATASEFAAEGYLEQFRHDMSRPQYDALLQQRRQVRSELEGQRMSEETLQANPELAVKVTPDMMSYGDEHLTMLYGDLNDKDEEAVAEMRVALRQELREKFTQFQRENKRQPEQAEWEAIIDALMVRTNLEQGGGRSAMRGHVPVFFADNVAVDGDEVELFMEYDDVPASERETIAARLLMMNGQTPTEEEVARAYADLVQVRAGSPPGGRAPDEVPPAAMAFLTSPPPGSGVAPMTPEDVALAYQQYVMGVLTGAVSPDTPFVPAPLPNMSPTGVPQVGLDLPMQTDFPNGMPPLYPRAE